jgi:hypothetical protein
MQGRAGVVLTAGLALMALALATLQAVVVAHHDRRYEQRVTAAGAPSAPANRFSAPGGRSGIPWVPFDKAQPPAKPLVPESPEGRTPPPARQEEHRSPPPSRFRGAPPKMGPQRPRSAVA